MNVLVTGANGFIGWNLVCRLEERGYKINVLVRNKEKFKFAGKVNIFEGNILNAKVLREAVAEAETVFHLVGKTHDFSHKNNREDYYKINVEGTRTLLDACVNSGIKQFIFFSSVKVMAEQSKYPLDETDIANPTTLYGETKLLAERLIAEYGRRYGFRTISLRLPLVYGPGVKGNIYKMIEAIDKGRFVMMGRGMNKRSMVYVGNVVDAAILVMESETTDDKVYLVTDSVDYSVRDLYRLIAKGLSKEPLPLYVPMVIAKILAITGDIGGRITRMPLPFSSLMLGKLTSSLLFTSRRIQEEIGFEPKHNILNTIDEMIRWYREEKSNTTS